MAESTMTGSRNERFANLVTGRRVIYDHGTIWFDASVQLFPRALVITNVIPRLDDGR